MARPAVLLAGGLTEGECGTELALAACGYRSRWRLRGPETGEWRC